MQMSSKVVEVVWKPQESHRAGVRFPGWVSCAAYQWRSARRSGKSSGSRNQIYYVLHWTTDSRGFGVTVLRGRDRESAEEWWSIDRSLIKPPPFATEEDVAILGLLWAERSFDSGLRAFGLGPMHGAECLGRMAQTGRLYVANDFSPLAVADARPGRIAWQVDANGRQRPVFKAIPEATLVLPLARPWFVDLSEGTLGPLMVQAKPEVITQLFSLPPLSVEDARAVATALSELGSRTARSGRGRVRSVALYRCRACAGAASANDQHAWQPRLA
jgi:hypothetical protein